MQKRGKDRAYAQRWRELAAQVKPPITKKEIVGTFLNTMRKPYYSHLIGHTTSNFADLVIVGERVEDGIKSGQLIDVQALQSLIEQQTRAGPSHKSIQKTTDAQMVATNPTKQMVYVPLAPQAMQSQPVPQQQHLIQNRTARANPGRQERKKFYTLPIALSKLLPQLLEKNLLTLVPAIPVSNPPPRNFNPNARCAFHSGQVGHWTDQCYALKCEVQNLLDKELIELKSVESKTSINVITEESPYRFDSSQLITPPGTKVRVQLIEEPSFPEIAMIA